MRYSQPSGQGGAGPLPRARARALRRIALAAGVAIAGIAALLGNRGSTAAEVRGAPLAAARTAPAAAAGAPIGATAATGAPSVPSPATATALAELLDLDQLVLVPGSAGADATAPTTAEHYEARLKDGRRATLTLDPGLQAYAERLLVEARAPRGAIVAMAPDGRILALAGRRSDERAFNWRLATEVWAPAASVFKLVTASALVAAGVDPSDKVCFHGGIRSVLESNLHDDKRDSRCESLTYGVAHSNNAILGKFAFQKLDPEALTRLAHALGVDDNLPGSELRGAAGAIAIPGLRDLSFAQTAAGFAGSQLSAVGGALLAATFADDGEQPVPRLVASIDGVALPVPARRRAVTSEVARAVGKMMMATCEFGSASRSFGRHQAIQVAGKTGTLARTQPFYMEHSWFVGYAPAARPEIVVSVVLGNPENWRLRGHEAARRLIDRALDRGRPGARPGAGRATGHDKDRRAKVASSRRAGW